MIDFYICFCMILKGAMARYISVLVSNVKVEQKKKECFVRTMSEASLTRHQAHSPFLPLSSFFFSLFSYVSVTVCLVFQTQRNLRDMRVFADGFDERNTNNVLLCDWIEYILKVVHLHPRGCLLVVQAIAIHLGALRV